MSNITTYPVSKQQPRLSNINSTSAPLGSSETFTGEWESVDSYDSISVACKADQDCNLYIDFTSNKDDGITESTLEFDIEASVNKVHRLTVTRPYFRVRLVNGTSAMSTLSLSSIKGSHSQLSAPLNLSLSLDSDATAVRPNSFEDEVVIGRRSGVSSFTKFGYREGLTATNGEETIWATSGNFTPLTSASTFTIAYNNTTDGLGTTGALTLYIQYIDSNGLAAVANHTLGSTGSDTTSFSGLGINRIAVSSSGSEQTNTNAITITATTGGTTQAYIPALNGVTQQAVYFVGSASRAIVRYLWINCNKLSGGGSPRVLIKGYVYNRNIATRFEIFRVTIDTNSINIVEINEPVGFSLSPSDVIYFIADTDTNNTIVNIRFSLREYKN